MVSVPFLSAEQRRATRGTLMGAGEVCRHTSCMETRMFGESFTAEGWSWSVGHVPEQITAGTRAAG